MTLAHSLPRRPSFGASSAAASGVASRESTLRLAIHDATRIEWSFAVPLPDAAERDYEMSAELLVPSNTFVSHSPWEQLQMYSRLDGAGGDGAGRAHRGADRHLPTVDAIRRETVDRASALADLGRLFARHCRLGGSLFAMAAHSDLEDGLRDALAAAAELAGEGRRERIEPAELGRERVLADEWVSARYIELLASAERSLAGVLESRSPHLEQLAPAIDRLQDEVADALGAEVQHRETCGYLVALADDGPETLERYLDRTSTLKKHFQEVHFLEMESRRPAERIQLWARVVATLLAGTLAFFLQLQLTLHASRSSEVGSGLTALAVVAGLSYAARDRFKESGREWLAGKMARLYAQRVTVLRLPSRRSHRRSIVATARESVQESRVKGNDPLVSSAVTSVKYVQRARVRPQPLLRAEGTSRVKLVFRYDLSPLFARMDDPVKKLPILTPGSRRVRFADAPRCYRMQVRLTLKLDGRTEAVQQTLVLSKRGLERIEEIG